MKKRSVLFEKVGGWLYILGAAIAFFLWFALPVRANFFQNAHLNTLVDILVLLSYALGGFFGIKKVFGKKVANKTRRLSSQ